jgi:hypothetical protein
VKLQVVWQRDFSGAADGAAMFFRDFDMCSCVVTVAAAAQDTAEGAVGIAAGGAAGDLSEAASAVRIFTGELRGGESSDLATK